MNIEQKIFREIEDAMMPYKKESFNVAFPIFSSKLQELGNRYNIAPSDIFYLCLEEKYGDIIDKWNAVENPGHMSSEAIAKALERSAENK